MTNISTTEKVEFCGSEYKQFYIHKVAWSDEQILPLPKRLSQDTALVPVLALSIRKSVNTPGNENLLQHRCHRDLHVDMDPFHLRLDPKIRELMELPAASVAVHL